MKKCPRCSYSLEGLPEDHVCPECSFEYHGETSYVTLDHGSFDRFVLMSLPVILAFPASLMHPAIRESTDLVIRLSVIFLLITFVVRHLLRTGYDRSGELVVDRNGIRAIFSDSKSVSVSWEQVNRAKYNWWTGRLIVLGLNGQKLLSVPVWKLGYRRNGEECVALITVHVIEYHFRVERVDSSTQLQK